MNLCDKHCKICLIEKVLKTHKNWKKNKFIKLKKKKKLNWYCQKIIKLYGKIYALLRFNLFIIN